ncbi:MAG: LysM peptidoglycan-binding domain-containing protein [Chloroflexota bacterium]
MTISHKKAQKYIRSSTDDVLSTDQRAELDQHLSTCDNCKRYAHELEQLDTLLTKALQSRYSVSIPTTQEVQRVTNQVEKQVRRHQMIQCFTHPIQAAVKMGLVLTLVIATVWFAIQLIPKNYPASIQQFTPTSELQTGTPKPASSLEFKEIPGTPSTIPENAIVYIVQEGDTLLAISAKIKVPVGILMALNGLSEQLTLHKGQLLIVGISTGSMPPALSLPTPMVPVPLPELLTPQSDPEIIRNRMAESWSLWHTLWVDATLTWEIGGTSSPLVMHHQAWVRQPDFARLIEGPLGEEPEYLWLTTEGSNLLQIHLLTGERTQYKTGSLLFSPLNDLLFPSRLAWQEGDIEVTGSDIVAGRETVVIEWVTKDGWREDRFWVDAITGVILRRKHFTPQAYPSIPDEIHINAIYFNVVIPSHAFLSEVSDTVHFDSGPSTSESVEISTFAELDLNCDGHVERITGIKALPIEYFNIEPQLLFISLETLSEGSYQQVWEHTAEEAGVAYLAYTIFPVNGCDYFIGILGHKGKESIKIYRWDGEQITTELSISGRFLFADEGWMFNFFGLESLPMYTVSTLEFQQRGTKNVWILRGYQWDGYDLIQTIEIERHYPAGG